MPELYKIIDDANTANIKQGKTELPKYIYPDEVITSTKVAWFSKYGVEFSVPENESCAISALDAQKKRGKVIFGTGFIISERAAAERAAAERTAAERAAAERTATECWQLSDREKEIVSRLSQSGSAKVTNNTVDRIDGATPTLFFLGG
jgi:hypothetical protein